MVGFLYLKTYPILNCYVTHCLLHRGRIEETQG